MQKRDFRVNQIDHVEIFVPDRYEAAKWYETVLGLTTVGEFEEWAAPPAGPLMISSDGGNTKIALFTGTPGREREIGGFHLIAFSADGKKFVEFLERLADVPVFNETGKQVLAKDVADHGKAYSIYFCDPYGNRLEVTTYDYEQVKEHLKT